MTSERSTGQRNSSRAGSPQEAGFSFPLPLDPLRVLRGILARWYWLLLFVVLLGVAGGGFGLLSHEPRFSVSLPMGQLEVTNIVKASQIGESYRPPSLDDRALLATLTANKVISRASAKLGLDASLGTVRSRVEAEVAEGGIFYITYHSPDSPEAALAFLEAWSEEIIFFSKERQKEDAQESALLLRTQIGKLTGDLEQQNRRILNFVKETNFVGADLQFTTLLGNQARLELELERINAQRATRADQINAYISELKRQGPIDEQIKKAQDELSVLRARYTDGNPLVQEKLSSIAFLEEKQKELQSSALGDDESSLQQYTGTPLGNQIFLNLIERRNEKLELDRLARQYQDTLGTYEAQLEGLSEQQYRYNEMTERRSGLQESLRIFNSRLREAEVFASIPQGYWEIFQYPDASNVVASSRSGNAVLLGAAGGFIGLGLGFFIALALELTRPSHRTAFECCAGAEAPLLASIRIARGKKASETEPDPWQAPIQELWLAWLARLQQEGILTLVWTGVCEPAHEELFWERLTAEVKHDGQALTVFDLTPTTNPLSLADGNGAGPAWIEVHEADAPDLMRSIQTVAKSSRILVRAAGVPKGAVREYTKKLGFWFALISANGRAIESLGERRRLLKAILPPIDGAVAIVESRSGLLNEMTDKFSNALAERFSRLPKPFLEE
ncbi:MAG: hypothetical protein AAF555_00150 [Verrucomicrobiota bacterium]